MEKVLVVEDADSLREVIQSVLTHEGFSVDAFASAEEALGALSRNTYACVLSDFKLPKEDGLFLLRAIRKISQQVPFILMTAYGSIDIAVEAMKNGANDFITKPIEPTTLCSIIRDVIDHRRIVNRKLGTNTQRDRHFLSKDPVTNKLLRQAAKAARVDTSVLILGESGVGKELVARYIHDQSPRSDKPFVAVNCAAMPEDLLESEFFGHEAGAFTGATQSRVGVLEFASEGTIFLDEVGDMSPQLQVKLLRALQEGEIKKIGSNKVKKVHPRVIAATNCDIEESIENNKLREDFYYRLAVISFTIPPLRERPSDISMLIEYYTEYFCSNCKKETIEFSKEALQLLRAYSWPGNARELENVIERAVILAEDDVVKPEHLGLTMNLDFTTIEETMLTLPEIAHHAARIAEVDAITKILVKTSGNKTKAAQMLGVSYKTLLNKVKEYNIQYS